MSLLWVHWTDWTDASLFYPVSRLNAFKGSKSAAESLVRRRIRTFVWQQNVWQSPFILSIRSDLFAHKSLMCTHQNLFTPPFKVWPQLCHGQQVQITFEWASTVHWCNMTPPDCKTVIPSALRQFSGSPVGTRWGLPGRSASWLFSNPSLIRENSSSGICLFKVFTGMCAAV